MEFQDKRIYILIIHD